MTESFAPSSRFRVHRIVLLVLASLAIVLSALVWFHPSLGYAGEDSVIAGADLRSPLIQILWWLFAAFAVVSSAIAAAVPERWPAAIRHVATYVAGVAALPPCLVLLDKYY